MEQIIAVDDWPKYLPSLVSIPFKFLKDSQNALLPFSGRLFSHLLVGERLRQLCTLTSLHDSSCLVGLGTAPDWRLVSVFRAFVGVTNTPE